MAINEIMICMFLLYFGIANVPKNKLNKNIVNKPFIKQINI